jgi:hypothetical protein
MQGEVSHKRQWMAASSGMGIGCDGVGATDTGERHRWNQEPGRYWRRWCW